MSTHRRATCVVRGRAFLNQFVCEVEIDDTALFGWSFLLESGLADASKEAFENLLLLIDWALPPKARVSSRVAGGSMCVSL